MAHHTESSQCSCHDHDHQKHDHHHDSHHEHHNHHHEKPDPIKIQTHETSVVGSFQIDLKESFSKAEEIMEESLKCIADAVMEIGGIVGHIKGFIQSQGENCMLSITDESVNKKYGKSKACKIDGVAIVFNIEPDQLRKIIQKQLYSTEA